MSQALNFCIQSFLMFHQLGFFMAYIGSSFAPRWFFITMTGIISTIGMINSFLYQALDTKNCAMNTFATTYNILNILIIGLILLASLELLRTNKNDGFYVIWLFLIFNVITIVGIAKVLLKKMNF